MPSSASKKYLYAYAVYPALMWLGGRAVRRNPSIECSEWPTVTVTLPVYNGERSIRSKLDDLVDLEYPAQKLQVLVISDASTDETGTIAPASPALGVDA